MDKNIAAFLRTDTKTIGARFIKDKFKDDSLELGEDSLQLSDRAYTYITDLSLAVGDLVVVYAVGVPKVAMVARVDEELDIQPNDTIEYKWVISKVDVAHYLNNCKKNAELTRTIGKAYQKNVRNQFRDMLLTNVDADTKTALLSIMENKDERKE